MELNELRSKRRINEDVQEELVASVKKIERQAEKMQRVYHNDRKNREEILEYFYGEPEYFIFEKGLEENQRNELRFFENNNEILRKFSQMKSTLEKENDELYKKELSELKKGR